MDLMNRLTGDLPLAGVRVIDLTAAMLGPSATQILADYGAEVIKVERPEGDSMRHIVPDRAGTDNPMFLSLNRNKRSIRLDLTQDVDRDMLREMIGGADVVVSNYRAGVMERLGFGYEDLRVENPRLVWASGTAFGATGPLSHKAGIDQLAQATSGLMAARAFDGAQPTVDPVMMVDYTGSMHLVLGILLALMQRSITGRGQKVEASLYDSALSLQVMEATEWLNRGTVRNFARMPLNGVYETSDGHVLMMGIFHKDALKDISAALDLGEDLTERPEFSDQDRQFENMADLQAIFRDRIRTEPTEEWIRRFEALKIKCSPVIPMPEALESDQTEVNEMILTSEHPRPEVGTFRTLASPIHLSESPVDVRMPPPMLGEHEGEVFAEFGFRRDADGALRRAR